VRREEPRASSRASGRRLVRHGGSGRLRVRLRDGLSRLLARRAGAARGLVREGRAMSGKLGFVVGSGLVALGLDVVARSQTHTPYGPPSSALLSVGIAGRRVPCIARHGEDRAIAPHEVNYRANVWTLYQHGVRRLVGVNVVGTIAEDFRPGELAVPEQLIDYTWGRESTFGGGERGVMHAEFAEPFSAELAADLLSAGAKLGLTMRRGVYGVT